jgi:hypothetical protein
VAGSEEAACGSTGLLLAFRLKAFFNMKACFQPECRNRVDVKLLNLFP